MRTSLLLAAIVFLAAPAFAQSLSANPDGVAGGPLPIPDNTPVGITDFGNDITDHMIITSITSAPLVVTHTWAGDLIYTITSGAGTSVVVMDRPGVPASVFGCDGDNIDVNFDDAGADGPVEDMCADLPAIFGNAIPNNPLSVLIGEDIFGQWSITISDNAAGDTGVLESWNITWDAIPPVANEAGPELPEGYQVSSAYPNPFNPQTQFVVQVSETQDVVADVYNTLGQKVAQIFDGIISAGQTETVTFEADNLPSGLYVVRVTGQEFSTTRLVSLLK